MIIRTIRPVQSVSRVHTNLGAGGLAALVAVADDQNHSRPQGCDIPVVVLQGGNCGVVRAGDRIQGFALLDLVMLHRGMDNCAGSFFGRPVGRPVGRSTS